MDFLQINLAVAKSLLRSQTKQNLVLIGLDIKKQLIEGDLTANQRRSLRELLRFARIIYLNRF